MVRFFLVRWLLRRVCMSAPGRDDTKVYTRPVTIDESNIDTRSIRERPSPTPLGWGWLYFSDKDVTLLLSNRHFFKFRYLPIHPFIVLFHMYEVGKG
jgi:hypothetical protein